LLLLSLQLLQRGIRFLDLLFKDAVHAMFGLEALKLICTKCTCSLNDQRKLVRQKNARTRSF